MHDNTPLEPEAAATLAVIDATLAGEVVDPRDADLAELVLILASERPPMRDEFSRSLDERVAHRFQTGGSRSSRWRTRQTLTRPTWMQRPRLATLGPPAAVLGGLAAVLIVVNAVPLGGGSSGGSSSSSAPGILAAPSVASAGSSSASGTAPNRTFQPAVGTVQHSASAQGIGKPASSSKSNNGPAVRQPAPVTPGGNQSPQDLGPAPVNQPGRQIAQSAQLALSTAPNRVDTVAQEALNVVGAFGGIVNSSTVTQTGGPDGSAQLQLSIPSANLPQALRELSALHYATVSSRTDNSQDVTDQYNAAQAGLADARALRTALLKQLANAYTTSQIQSLQAQIHDAEASIASNLAALRTVQHRVSYSPVSLSIQAVTPPPPPPTTHHSGFTLGGAWHTAKRVLVVAAGVALVALAGGLPLVLVIALAWWIASGLRRRGREHALDMA